MLNAIFEANKRSPMNTDKKMSTLMDKTPSRRLGDKKRTVEMVDDLLLATYLSDNKKDNIT